MGLPHYVVDDYIVLVKLLIVTTLHGPTSNYCLCPKAPLCRILGWEGIHPKHHIFHRFYSGLSGNFMEQKGDKYFTSLLFYDLGLEFYSRCIILV